MTWPEAFVFSCGSLALAGIVVAVLTFIAFLRFVKEEERR